MPNAKRTIPVAAFHVFLMAVGWVSVRAIIGSWWNIPFVVGAVVFAELSLVVWWVSARAFARHAGSRGSTMEAFRKTGVRWGAIGGVVFWIGLLATWVAVALVSVWFFEPEDVEYNFVGGRYAVALLAAIVLLPGAAIAVLVGGALGGVIGIIDRALLPVAHLVLRTPRNR